MNTKGVSAVIATILMLMITIALAGTAYLYITGIFTAKSGVVLSIDTQTACAASVGATGGNITVVVRNDGTNVAQVSSITVANPGGTAVACTWVTLPFSVNAGSSASAICMGRAATGGIYGVSASAGTSSASGSVYCNS